MKKLSEELEEKLAGELSDYESIRDVLLRERRFTKTERVLLLVLLLTDAPSIFNVSELSEILCISERGIFRDQLVLRNLGFRMKQKKRLYFIENLKVEIVPDPEEEVFVEEVTSNIDIDGVWEDEVRHLVPVGVENE